MSRAVRAGKAFVEVGLKSKVNEGVRRIQIQMRSIGRSIGSFGKGLTAVGVTGAAALAAPVNAASEFQESFSKFETVFGDNAKAAKKWSDNFANDVGRAKSQVVDFMGQAQDTFVPLGFDPAEAEAMSKQLTTLAVDLASFNNMSDEQAFDKLLSSVVGNTENLRSFGVVAQDAQIKARAFQMGFDPKALTPYQKAQVIMKLAIEGTTNAQGDAIKTAGSYANQIKRLQGKVMDLAVAIGTPLLDALASIASVLSRTADGITAWVQQNREVVVGIGVVTAVALGLGSALLATSFAITVVNVALGAMSTIVGLLAGAVGLITSPVFLAVGAITALGAASIYAGHRAGAFAGAWQSAQQVIGPVLALVKQTLGGISAALSSGDFSAAAKILWLGIKAAFWEGARQVALVMPQLYVSIFNSFNAFAVSFADRIFDVFSRIPRLIENAKKGNFGAFSVEIAQAGIAQVQKVAAIDIGSAITDNAKKTKSDLLAAIASVKEISADAAVVKESNEFGAKSAVTKEEPKPVDPEAAAKAAAIAEEGKRLTEEVRSPLEKLQAEQERIGKLFAAGAISETTAERAGRNAQEDFDQTTKIAVKDTGRNTVADFGSQAALDTLKRTRGGQSAIESEAPWAAPMVQGARDQVAAVRAMPARMAEVMRQQQEELFDTAKLEETNERTAVATEAISIAADKIAANTQTRNTSTEETVTI